MDRRAVLGGLAAALFGPPRPVRAQGPPSVPLVGAITGWGRAPRNANYEAFLEGLRAAGYKPGQDIRVERLQPEPGKVEQYPSLVSRLVAQRPEVILASNPHAIEAVVHVTQTIPIVGVDLESDPVARGWVASLSRPGGNLTGFFLDIPEMSGKQLQFLREVDPKLVRVAVLGDSRVNDLQFKATEVAARAAGLTVHLLPVNSIKEIPGAVREARRQRAGGLVALTSPLVYSALAPLAEHAVKHHLVSICPFSPAFAEEGGLLAYGPHLPDMFRRAAGYVDRILKGAKADGLPVQRPEKFELAINLKTARALKLTLPQSLVLRADRVIE